MFSKVNRAWVAGSMAVSMLATSPLHAVSDEVALQMLDRLNELEKEVSDLRGENESLRNELSTLQSAQRDGFLQVDERVSGLENQDRAPTPVAAPVTVRTAPAPVPAASDLDDIPALEAPASRPEPAQPAQSSNEQAVEQRKAVAPAEVRPTQANGAAVEKVDPKSPDSYYYYGTADQNKTAEVAKSVSESVDASKASLVQERAAEEKAPTPPAAHQVKAEYNEAYKTLVNNPASAVPAFRRFLRQYPDHELSANAQYWLGEALYAQQDYAGASKEFMTVLKQHKGSPKAPGAALKLGYCFYELKQWEFARRTLEDTIRFFPDTNSAKLAQVRLERMDKENR